MHEQLGHIQAIYNVRKNIAHHNIRLGASHQFDAFSLAIPLLPGTNRTVFFQPGLITHTGDSIPARKIQDKFINSNHQFNMTFLPLGNHSQPHVLKPPFKGLSEKRFEVVES